MLLKVVVVISADLQIIPFHNIHSHILLIFSLALRNLIKISALLLIIHQDELIEVHRVMKGRSLLTSSMLWLYLIQTITYIWVFKVSSCNRSFVLLSVILIVYPFVILMINRFISFAFQNTLWFFRPMVSEWLLYPFSIARKRLLVMKFILFLIIPKSLVKFLTLWFCVAWSLLPGQKDPHPWAVHSKSWPHHQIPSTC